MESTSWMSNFSQVFKNRFFEGTDAFHEIFRHCVFGHIEFEAFCKGKINLGEFEISEMEFFIVWTISGN